MLYLLPGGAGIESRADIRRMTVRATGLYIPNATIAFGGLCRVVAAGAVTLLALHVLKPCHLD
jgi:hypothetical protein